LYELSMERGLLSPKVKGGGRGVKEKEGGLANSSGFVSGSDPKLGVDASPKLSESPSSMEGFVVNETVAKDKQSPLVNTAGLGSFTQLPTQETPSAGNAPGKSSYANVTCKPSGKKVNFRTLFTPGIMGLM
ncbi:hypothetical protein Tco_0095260, partial [Tanacetum coccineum]